MLLIDADGDVNIITTNRSVSNSVLNTSLIISSSRKTGIIWNQITNPYTMTRSQCPGRFEEAVKPVQHLETDHDPLDYDKDPVPRKAWAAKS